MGDPRRGVALLDTVAVLRAGDDALDVLGPAPFRVRGIGPRELALFERLKAGIPADELDAAVVGPKAVSLVAELERRGLLGPYVAPRDGVALRDDPLTSQRYWLAHRGDPDALQGRLTDERVVVLGCGGTGSVVAQHLAAIGVGSIAVVDEDVVEGANLNRQLAFRRADLGRPKALALVDHLAERHPALRLRGIRARIDAVDDVVSVAGDATTLFCCIDQPVGLAAARVARAAAALSARAVFGSVGWSDGAVGPLLHHPAALLAFAEDHERAGEAAARAVGRVAARSSFGPVNTVVSALLVHQWANHVLGVSPCAIDGRELVVDLNTFERSVAREWR